MAENVEVSTLYGPSRRKSESSWTEWKARVRLLNSHRVIVLVLAALFLVGTYSPALQRVETWFYDLALHLMPTGKVSSSVVVVAVDDEALQRIGPWPWPRDGIARTVDRLHRLKARAVGLTVPLTTPETPASLDKLVEEAAASRKLAATAKKWAARLDTDATLASAMTKAGKVVIAAEYRDGFQGSSQSLAERAMQDAESSGWNLGSLFKPLLVGPGRPRVTVQPPLERFLDAASGLGVVERASQGGHRRLLPLAVSVDDYRLPHLVTRLAAISRGARSSQLRINEDGRIALGNETYATGPHLGFYPLPVRVEDNAPPVPVYSAGALWDSDMGSARFRGKTVLFGITAPALVPRIVGPGGLELTPVTWSAFALASLLENSHMSVPAGFYALQRFFLMIVAASLWFMPLRLQGRVGILAGALGAAVMLNVELGFLLARQFWLPLVLPALLLGSVHAVLWLQRVLANWGLRGVEEIASVRRALGDSLRAQGKLNEAFEQYRLCPANGDILEPLYRLAQELERRRQLERAADAYKYLSGIKAGYRDVAERLKRLRPMVGGVMAPMGSGADAAVTRVLADPALEKPVLGHYRLERELGRGGMAVVYLATDSKLGRQVALKALSLSEEFEGKALEEAQQRFAREAEAAARLNHPNIVTVFETGNDDGLAYIAMDYAEGSSLDAFTQAGHLLPVSKVLEIGAQVADALHYAHGRDVVHRDIKPGNIIYDKRRDTVKVTDFGIARLTDESRTRTGMVMGTPLYMSPEQTVGVKVDGRSDLYSLGVTVYELLTGQPPFVADSVANLIYQIANTKPQSVRKVRPELPLSISRAVSRSLEKAARARFPTGKAMAEALLKCRAQVVDEEGSSARRRAR